LIMVFKVSKGSNGFLKGRKNGLQVHVVSRSVRCFF
jgi:hypothetical protein